MPKSAVVVWVGVFLASVGYSQPISIAPQELTCLPSEENAAVSATVGPEVGGSSVRLYFRRLNPVGAFYYDRMKPAGAGVYWSVFPKPEQREQHQLTDEWWEVLETRDWMQIEGRDRQWLEEWLERQEFEAAEYYVTVHDPSNRLLERSDVHLVEIHSVEDCGVELTDRERGWAENLTTGETTEAQAGRPPFHWLCDGIVTRIDADGVLRGDDFCRACVVGALPSPSGGSDHPTLACAAMALHGAP